MDLEYVVANLEAVSLFLSYQFNTVFALENLHGTGAICSFEFGVFMVLGVQSESFGL